MMKFLFGLILGGSISAMILDSVVSVTLAQQAPKPLSARDPSGWIYSFGQYFYNVGGMDDNNVGHPLYVGEGGKVRCE